MRRQLSTVCLFGIIVTVQLSESLRKDKVHFSTWLQHTGTGIYTFDWLFPVSVKVCLDSCKSTKACEYMNYEVRTHKCALLRIDDANSTSVATIESKPGFIFGNKSEWTMRTSAACTSCASYGKCHVDGESDGNVCRDSGCEYPGGHDVHGNMFSTGSIIRQLSSDVYQKCPGNVTVEHLKCFGDGNWSTVKTYCDGPYFKGSNYFIQRTPMTWQAAKTYCEDFSGYLVKIDSEEEQSFLAGLLVDEYKENTWIGANDLDVDGTFQWTDGSALSAYTHWSPGQPNNYQNNERCVHMSAVTWPGALYYWNDKNCEFKMQIACEF